MVGVNATCQPFKDQLRPPDNIDSTSLLANAALFAWLHVDRTPQDGVGCATVIATEEHSAGAFVEAPSVSVHDRWLQLRPTALDFFTWLHVDRDQSQSSFKTWRYVQYD